MHVKHGELLPRVDLEESNRSIGYYVAENATLTVYQPMSVSLCQLTLMFFLTGCILGCLLFVWTNNVYSVSAELAFLRSVSIPSSGKSHIVVMPSMNSQEAKKLNIPKPPIEQLIVAPVERSRRSASGKNYSIEISKKSTAGIVDPISNAIALSTVQDFKTAESTLLNQYRRGLSSPELLSALGVLYSNHGVWRKAALSFERACKKSNDGSLCYYNLAISYDHLKQPRKALDAYQQALSRSSNHHEFDVTRVRNRMQELREW